MRVKKKRRRPRLSRLGRFIRDNDLPALEVAEVTGISRQHLLRLRYGQAEPTRPTMIWLRDACRRMLKDRNVSVTDLFDLGE